MTARPPPQDGEAAEATQRLFFALWPQPDLQRRLHALAHASLHGTGGRLVSPENLHLTLVFLGAIGRDRRHCLEAAAGRVRTGRFSLQLDVAGYWPRPDAGWFGCNQPPGKLLDLVAALQAGAGGCGVDLQTRPYAAHVTVVRRPVHPPGAVTIAPVEWPVDTFVLAESQSHPDGVHYRPLRAWPL